MTKIRDLEERIGSLEPKPANTSKAQHRDIATTLIHRLSSLPEDEQIPLARLIHDLRTQSIDPKNFEAWLFQRPQDQQTITRKVLADLEEERVDQLNGSHENSLTTRTGR